MHSTKLCNGSVLCLLAWCALSASVKAQTAASSPLAAAIRQLDSRVYPQGSEAAKAAPQMLSQDVRARRTAANHASTAAWRQIQSREAWETFKTPKIEALRTALAQFPPVPADLHHRVTRTISADGFRIENRVFESRPGLLVTANLYLPASHGAQTATGSMPGILICHSHHNPKTESELQDMGAIWARRGCAVLVMDQLGHGERRQHPFVNAESYPGSFRPSRQDYYFRYNLGMQLHLIGDSLAGWMAWDLMRGVDLLLGLPGIDKQRIALFGAVAGGGDPCAVAAALDPRITVAAPFNFGGPQPETTYPLPADPENNFNYAGGGSWESTRNLRLSARDGFLPWVIVASLAPRGLIYGHEFAWDREHDPVWGRLGKIYAWYGSQRLGSSHGSGSVSGRPPESTHCNNIGPVHRQGIHAALASWWKIETPDEQFRQRHSADELACLTPSDRQDMKRLCDLAAAEASRRLTVARVVAEALPADRRRQHLGRQLAQHLGDIQPKTAPQVQVLPSRDASTIPGAAVERLLLTVEPGIVLPTILLKPSKANGKLPVVLALAQSGKQGFIEQRADVLAELLNDGLAICLPDLRGTGETRPDAGRGRSSSATALSAAEQMLGQTLVGSRLKDARSVLAYLRSRDDLDPQRIALWGDSFAAPNPPERRLEVPLDLDQPELAEPLGGLLALLGAVYDEQIAAVYVHRGLNRNLDLLASQFCHVPHDAVVPGFLSAADLSDLAATLAPRPLRLEALVDGLNREVAAQQLSAAYSPAVEAYRQAGARIPPSADEIAAPLSLAPTSSSARSLPAFLRAAL